MGFQQLHLHCSADTQVAVTLMGCVFTALFSAGETREAPLKLMVSQGWVSGAGLLCAADSFCSFPPGLC